MAGVAVAGEHTISMYVVKVVTPVRSIVRRNVRAGTKVAMTCPAVCGVLVLRVLGIRLDIV